MPTRAITAKLPNTRQFVSTLKSEFENAGKPAKRDFERTTSTWEHNPDFQIKVTEQGGAILSRKIELFVGVLSNYSKGKKADSADIYRFVTRGTKVRRAVMTPDFVPKTTPNRIGSGSGRGGVARIGRDIEMKGIEARNFEPIITKKHIRQIQRDGQKSFDIAAKKVGWVI